MASFARPKKHTSCLSCFPSLRTSLESLLRSSSHEKQIPVSSYTTLPRSLQEFRGTEHPCHDAGHIATSGPSAYVGPPSSTIWACASIETRGPCYPHAMQKTPKSRASYSLRLLSVSLRRSWGSLLRARIKKLAAHDCFLACFHMICFSLPV